MPARLLLVHHAPSTSLARLADAVVAGAGDPEIVGVEVVTVDPLEATADDLLGADGYVLGTAAHFGTMSGALKHLFDRTFLAIGGALDEPAVDRPPGSSGPSTAGRPFGLWVHGRYDVGGAVRSVTALTGALGWRQAAPVLEVVGDVAGDGTGDGDDHVLASAYELGATLAATLL